MKTTFPGMLKAYGTIFAGILILVMFSVLSPDAFMSVGNLINITRQISLLVVIAVGATVVMSVNEFDLSIGALASLGGITAAKLAVAGVPLAFAFTVPVALCFAIGYAGGWIVTRFRVLSFVTTLAMSTILGGVTFWVTGGATVFEHVPDSFRLLGATTIGALPLLSLIMLAVCLVFWFVMEQTTFGRKLYATGGNETAAKVSGINVVRHKRFAFALCGALSGFSGVLLSSRLGSAHPNGGDGMFMQSYAAVYIGMTVFREGTANIWGTLLGAAILGVLANGLTILGVPSFIQNIVTGLIIIGAIIMQKLGQNRE